MVHRSLGNLVCWQPSLWQVLPRSNLSVYCCDITCFLLFCFCGEPEDGGGGRAFLVPPQGP